MLLPCRRAASSLATCVPTLRWPPAVASPPRSRCPATKASSARTQSACCCSSLLNFTEEASAL
eukprot:3558313-Pyramimonas_sp.AAC.1